MNDVPSTRQSILGVYAGLYSGDIVMNWHISFENSQTSQRLALQQQSVSRAVISINCLATAYNFNTWTQILDQYSTISQSNGTTNLWIRLQQS